MKLSRKLTLVATVILGVNLAFPLFVMAQSAQPTFSSKFGTPQLNGPFGVTVDHSGNIYVADWGNSRVAKFDSSGNFLSAFGSHGSGNGQFMSAAAISSDASGNVYVTDGAPDDRIEKFDSSGTYQSSFGTNGSSNPQGVTVDPSGNIYLSDYGDNRIEKFNSSGFIQSQFGTQGTGDGQFNGPFGITTDISGNIYVTDYNNNRVEEFNSNGTFVSTWGWGVLDGSHVFQKCTSGCQAGISGSGDGQFTHPDGITVDGFGNIYVSDYGNNRIEEFDSAKTYQFQFGGSGSGNGQMTNPIGLATDSSNNIYVADGGNNRIDVFNNATASTSNSGQEVETVSPGTYQLTNVPANFHFPAVNITNFQTYNTTYLNQQTDPEKLTADDRRFSGGFEVQVTATDYHGTKSGDTIPVNNLGILTQIPNSTTSYTETTDLQNTYSNSEGTLIAGSQTPGAVISQTLPFTFGMYGKASNTIYICTTGAIIHAANLSNVNLQPSDFNSYCQGNGPVTGDYNLILPYFKNIGVNADDQLNTTANSSCTNHGFCFDATNGVYYNQVSDNEVHIRFKANTRNFDSTSYYDVEFSVYLFKDGRIEYHYGPVTDANSSYPTIGIMTDPGGSTQTLLANITPFNTGGSGGTPVDFSTSQIRFSPENTIFNDVSKPTTPPVYASINAAGTTDPSDFTMFTEDSQNPGNSVPVTVMQGAACDTQGRLGSYTVYPSFQLQIPPTTPSDTYQNTITFTILDDTVPSGTGFCSNGSGGGGGGGPSNADLLMFPVYSTTLDSTTSLSQGIGDNGLDVSGNDVYFSETQNNSLLSYDLTDPKSPSLISTTTTPNDPNTSGACAPGAVKTSGNYLYVAGTNGCNQLMIYDIGTTPGTPIYKGMVAVGTDPAAIGILDNVASSKLYAYVANKTSADITVLDVTDPTSPTFVTTFATTSLLTSGNTNARVGGIAVAHHTGTAAGDYAYFSFASTSPTDPSPPSQSKLYILNINDPTNPTLVSTWNWNSVVPSAYDVELTNDTNSVYIGNATATNNNNCEGLSVADPTTPPQNNLLGCGGNIASNTTSLKRFAIANNGGISNVFYGYSDQANLPIILNGANYPTDYTDNLVNTSDDPGDAIKVLGQNLVFSDGLTSPYQFEVMNASALGQSQTYRDHDIVYTVKGVNLGPGSANNVKIDESSLPAGTTFVSAYKFGYEQICSSLPCNFGTVGVNQGFIVFITLHVNPNYSGSSLSDTFNVTSDATDPDSSNNSQTVNTTVLDGNNISGANCQTILTANPGISSGTYTLTQTGGAPISAYCDMTTDGGGWTRVVGINASDANHVNSAAVNAGSMTTSTAYGKFDDNTINALKSGTDPAFRLICTGATTFEGFWQNSCPFSANTDAGSTNVACVAMSSTYPPTSYVGSFVQSAVEGLSDGNQGTNERLNYGANNGLTGCDTPTQHWSGSGDLWVR